VKGKKFRLNKQVDKTVLGLFAFLYVNSLILGDEFNLLRGESQVDCGTFEISAHFLKANVGPLNDPITRGANKNETSHRIYVRVYLRHNDALCTLLNIIYLR
jgi:hypothetical protein